MAESTLYDVLEVSNSASSETIVAAYERMAEKFDPAKEANANKPHARVQFDAVKQAFLTLGDAEKRAQYDRKLMMRSFTPIRPVETLEPFWSVPKMIIVGVIVMGVSGFYFKHQKERARIEADKVIAVAKAREAETKARAEAEGERMALQRERERERTERMEATQQRRERDADVGQYQRDNRVNDLTNRAYTSVDRDQARRDDSAKRSEDMRIRREEAQAAAASRQQLARDRAELCRIECDRYGKSLSC